MRIGIVALLHESNTFSSIPTTITEFQQDLLLSGESIRHELAATHHEVGGFFGELDDSGAEAVPLFAARALPSGKVTRDTFAALIDQMLGRVRTAGTLDGLLVAPHGATVSEEFADADGYWLTRLREAVGPDMPIVGTLDAHANLSPDMIRCCNALVGYRTNPHTDQRERGHEAAALLIRSLKGKIRPTMTAGFLPLAISIDRQCTGERHLRPLYEFADRQRCDEGVLSNSIVLGFPYADVAEMGSSVIVVTNDSPANADRMATDLANRMWQMRDELRGEFISVNQALDRCAKSDFNSTCLLDMGDNVGGGSSGDGTTLIAAIHARQLGPSFACLCDPLAVARCETADLGQRLRLELGGKTDALHGSPLQVEVTLRSRHDGQFSETQPRHGGIARFDQGRTAICTTDGGLTIMLTSRRMVPFSLQQIIQCGLDPSRFRFLVAKGVNAPIAAYREVCDQFIRVNTIGSTSADISQLSYRNRRRPMFPWEADSTWTVSANHLVRGHSS